MPCAFSMESPICVYADTRKGETDITVQVMFHPVNKEQQAGTGPSRRHIQGSKIAKGHQGFKVFSSTALKCFFEKSLTTPKKIERGDPLGFFYTQSAAKPQKKLKGDPLGKIFFRKKVLQCRKKLKGGTLWSRPALYVMRETFWFCSLGQQVKF